MVTFILNHITGLLALIAVGVVGLRIRKRKLRLELSEQVLSEIQSSHEDEPPSLHPEIDPQVCSGCAACTTACPEGDILKMVNHKAVLVSPTRCVGHGECERSCPMGAIKLVFGTRTRGMEIPRLSINYETNVPGLYIAGELGGMGLIRNAVKQGAAAARHALNHLSETKTDFDLLIVGAGPAGLASGLAAIAAKKKYLIIEQGTFGGTVANYPRQKMVMSRPFDLPVIGKSTFAGNVIQKETILAYWNDIRKRTGLRVQEGTKFETLEKKDDVFLVTTASGILSAKKVILAMGVRGTPRRLGIPGEELDKVTYNLIEPRQYQNMNLVVVGGGNAAVEAAQHLCDPHLHNRVILVVRGPNLNRCNSENMQKTLKLNKDGKLAISFGTDLIAVEGQRALLRKGQKKVAVKNDFVFIFAGTEVPRKFLMALGIKIDKKFGEGLGA